MSTLFRRPKRMPDQPDYASMPDRHARYLAFVQWHDEMCAYGQCVIENLPRTDEEMQRSIDVGRAALRFEQMAGVTPPLTVTEAEEQLLRKLRALTVTKPGSYPEMLDAVYEHMVSPEPMPKAARPLAYTCLTSCGCDGRKPAIECTSALGSCARCMFTTGNRGQDPT